VYCNEPQLSPYWVTEKQRNIYPLYAGVRNTLCKQAIATHPPKMSTIVEQLNLPIASRGPLWAT